MTQALREGGEAALRSYISQTAEERDAALAASFESAFHQRAQSLGQAEFDLQACLDILEAQLDSLVDVVDNIRFVQEEAESSGKSSTSVSPDEILSARSLTCSRLSSPLT